MQILILVHFIPSIWEHFVPPPVSFSSSPGTDPLTFRDGVEVSVIYFRAGYEPGHYYALIYAAAGNHPHTCNELLVYRPDVTHSNEDGETAFQAACLFDRSLPGVWEPSEEAHVQRQCVYGTT